MRKMGSEAGAIGFAVYLDALERFEEKLRNDNCSKAEWLNQKIDEELGEQK